MSKPKVYITRRLPQVAFDELIRSCDVHIHDSELPPSYEQLLANIKDKDGLLCLLTDQVDAALILAAPNLKVISQCAVGYDNIDIQAAAQHGITVGNTPGVLTDATADFAFALLMAAARRIGEAIDYIRDGHWQTWGLTTLLGQQIWGTTLGIVGLGRIGRALAQRARGFQMRLLYSDSKRQPQAEEELGIDYCSLEELLQQSDFISLHVNLTPNTTDLIDRRALSMMKPTAILINTSRGPVVDTEALFNALKTKQIAYAALDVSDPEPLPADHKLLTLPNLIVAPHIASATVSVRQQMALMAVRNLVAGVHGKPLPNPVIPK